MSLHRLPIGRLAYGKETQLAKSYYEYYCYAAVPPSKTDMGRDGLLSNYAYKFCTAAA